MEQLDNNSNSVGNVSQDLFEENPISLWEEDISEIKKFIDQLKNSGVNDFRAYFEQNPDVINKLLSMVKIVKVNKKTIQIYEVSKKEKLINNLKRTLTNESLEAFREEIIAFSEGKNTFESETNTKTLKNKEKNIYMKVSIVPGYENTWSRVIVYIIDNSKLKELENKLQDTEERLKEITSSIPEIRFWHLFNPKEYEVALRKSYEIIQIVMNNIPQYIYWKDTNSAYLGCNRNYAKFLGLENTKDIIGKKDGDLIINEERVKQLKERESNVIIKRKPEYNITEKQILENGNIIWLNTCRIPLFDSKKNVVGILVASEDITEKRLVIQKLKESEEKYRTVVEKSLQGIGILQDVKIVFANNALAEILGYTVKELYSLSAEEVVNLIYIEDRDLVLKRHKERLNGKKVPSHYTFRVIRKNNQIRWVDMYASLIEYGGKPTVQEVFIDITDKKNAERKLKESESKYRDLVESSSMGLLEIDVINNRVAYINPKLLEIIGYSRDELNDENIFPKIIHHEDFKDIFQNREEGVLEFRIITKDRKLKWLAGDRKHHYDVKGELANLRLWLRDITKEKELEEIKSNLITRFSHEFKTPLISIKGFTQFLLTEYRQNLDDGMISFLSKIMDGSEKLKTLIDSFIESSQLNEDVVKVTIKQENLSDVIKMGLEEMEGMIKIRNHKINLNIKENLIVNFNREKIYIVFTNLLLNSIKYTPKGGKISIQSHITDNFITITLKDNGVGLNEEEKLKLFKPFGKIERYGQGWDVITDGMGMGLYISKEIIDLHGGKIWVESEGRNRGSIFNFSLPASKNQS